LEWFIYALLAAVFASIGGLINKKILFHEHVLEFTASRSLFFVFFALFLIPFVDFSISWKIYVLIYFVSLLVTGGIIYFLKSIRHGEVSSMTPLTNISPLFLLIIAYFVLGEAPTPKQYFGVFLLILGAYSLEVGITDRGFLEPIKVFLKSKIIHYMFFSLVIFSVTATFDKLIITNHTTFVTYLFLLTMFKSINFVSLEVYRFGFSEIMHDFKKDFKLLFSDSIFLFFGQLSYFFAVSFPNAFISLIIPIKRTSTLFTTIFGGKLFHEKNLLVKVLACIIMIWGAVFILL